MNKFTFKISGIFNAHEHNESRNDFKVTTCSINEAMEQAELIIKNNDYNELSFIQITNLVHKCLVIHGDVIKHENTKAKIDWLYPKFTHSYIQEQVHELEQQLGYSDTSRGRNWICRRIKDYDLHLAKFNEYGGIYPAYKDRRIDEYALVNDTDDWVVVFNNYFGLFPSEYEARKIIKKAQRAGVHTPKLMTPYSHSNMAHIYLQQQLISTLKPINIVGYIDKAISKRRPSRHSALIDQLAIKDPKFYLDDLRQKLLEMKTTTLWDDDYLHELYEKGIISQSDYFHRMTIANQPDICSACGTWDCPEMLAGEMCSGV
jgi:hypothetical protein